MKNTVTKLQQHSRGRMKDRELSARRRPHRDHSGKTQTERKHRTVSLAPRDFRSPTFADTNTFFDHELAPPVEVWEGTLQEGQISFLAGDYALAKTPFSQQLALSVAAGLPFLGRRTTKRPVIVLDAESTYGDYRPNIERIAHRLELSPDHISWVNLF